VRETLSDRRPNMTIRVEWVRFDGSVHPLLVTLGFRRVPITLDAPNVGYKFQIAEIFCADFKAGSDNFALITDTCILVSRLLQHGETVGSLLTGMCEPRSLIGTILEAAAREEHWGRAHE